MKTDVEKLAQAAEVLAKGHEFEALGPIAERHGSWEIVFWRKSDGLDRFVSVAMTEMPRSWDVELRAGAEAEGRFTRRLLAEFNIGRDEFGSAEFRQALKEGMDRAVDVVKRIDAGQLVEAYLPARKGDRAERRGMTTGAGSGDD